MISQGSDWKLYSMTKCKWMSHWVSIRKERGENHEHDEGKIGK